MKTAKIVCGANYGDEGKGLITDYFSAMEIARDNQPLVVLHNGSCQRSHTVSLVDGTRHAFQHFSAGTFSFAHTCFADTFIVNPIYFKQEYLKVEQIMKQHEMKMPMIYVDPKCRVATPYDAFINQAVEESREHKNHGSCGYGVFETIMRYKNQHHQQYYFKDYKDMTLDDFLIIMNQIIGFAATRLLSYGITEISNDLFNIFNNKEFAIQFYDDLRFMIEHTEMRNSFDVMFNYDSVIFEGGQGLLLDEDNLDDYPHLTPSHTGSYNPYNLINKYQNTYQTVHDIEICYVTRTYLTRHGAGKLPNECRKEDINADIEDLTNVPNPYQHAIRYAKLDLESLQKRINNDFEIWNGIATKSLAITHMNYTDNTFCAVRPDKNTLLVQKLYLSDGMIRESVRTL